jgi:hypothetical protein
MNLEVEKFVGELRLLREEVAEQKNEIAELKSKLPTDPWVQAQIDYDRFDG